MATALLNHGSSKYRNNHSFNGRFFHSTGSSSQQQQQNVYGLLTSHAWATRQNTVVPFDGAHMAADPNWYPDTGATHHMTSMPVHNPQPCGGLHNVYMGNGDSMSISHTGTLPLSLGSSQFSLSNVFHIPNIRKNLLSVAQFTKDNRVYFLFAPNFYQIYCLLTGRLLFQGPCKDGLYPLLLPNVSTAPQALVSTHSSLWHNRLGHPFSHVLARLGSSIGSKLSFHCFCRDCALSKSHELPFQSHTDHATSLFHVNYLFLHIALVAVLALVHLSPNTHITKEPMTIFKKNLMFFVFITFSLKSVPFSTSAALVSFANLCASLPPDYSTPEIYSGVNSTVHRLTGFYYASDGSNILSQNSTYGEVQNSIVFRFWYDESTDEQGLFMVQGSLEFPSDTTYFLVGNSTSSRQATDFTSESVSYGQGSTSFKLNGIWSEASGELCMVGSGSGYSQQGNLLTLPAVLKLYKLKNSSSLTSLITGTLESLVSSKNEPNYFGPISMSMFPSMNYQYTFASNKSHNSYSDASGVSPSSLKIGRFCSVISNLVLIRQFELKYPSHCVSAKKCSPLAVSYLSRAVSLRNIECLEDKQRLRVLVDFASGSIWHQRPFNPSTILVGEGSWDAKKNQLCVVACRFLNATNSLNTSHVGDCSTRLSFWFPARWTIGNTSSIVGQIWSNKTTAESDYFENITFESGQSDVRRFALQGQEYEYTKIDEVTKLCQRTKTANDNNNIYPHPFSYDMRFHISAKNSTGEEIAWGISVPLSVGNQLYYPFSYSIEDGTEEYFLGSLRPPMSFTYNQSNPHKISYRISIKAIGEFQLPNGFYILNEFYEMVVSAEGIYDDTEGSLCMVGCRDLGTNRHQQPTSDSVDCNIVVNFEFPPTNPKSSYPSFIKGSIESTRKKSDPLYFEQVNLTSAASYTYEAERSIWRMDLEIILVFISNTLACVFGALQLFHVKRHPDVLPSISVCMLNILAVGYIIPLMLNFDAMLTPHSSQTLFLGSNGWHEFNEIIVSVLTMVGFFLQIRLLQLPKSARSANGNQKELWGCGEAGSLCGFTSVAGSLAALLMMNWRRRDYIVEMASRYQGLDILGTVLKTCAGLLLDAFLLPQILLNIFCKSKENALAVSFYTGTTFVRVLPHAYDLYRAHTSSHDHLNESYIYASPAAYFYSTTWNVIIPCGGILFAVIIYLQQRFGGRCILPSKLREFGVYEKVSIVSEAS